MLVVGIPAGTVISARDTASVRHPAWEISWSEPSAGDGITYTDALVAQRMA